VGNDSKREVDIPIAGDKSPRHAADAALRYVSGAPDNGVRQNESRFTEPASRHKWVARPVHETKESSMNVKKYAAKGAIATVLGLSTLGLGAGAGAASADPGPPCWEQCNGHDHGNRGRGPDRRFDDFHQGPPGQVWDRPWDQRFIDDARFDHRPFNWQGQRVEPYWDAGRYAWGFWFFGIWIPL
jgi:hypothetical protein